MAFNSIPSGDIATGKPLKQGLFQYIKDNFDYLKAGYDGLAAGAGIPNGSLEVDSDADVVPDNWTWAAFNTGTKAFDTTGFVHGTKSFKITRASGASYGGGSLTSDYVECSFLELLHFGIAFKCSAASIVNSVYIRFFDANKTEMSAGYWYTTSADNAGFGRQLWTKVNNNPLYWTWLRILNVGVPVSARYFKLVFAAGEKHASYYAAADINVDRITMNPTLLAGSIMSETVDQAEVGNAGPGSWTDIGSTVAITVPTGVKYLDVQVQTRASSGDDAQGRCAISTTYGTAVSNTTASYLVPPLTSRLDVSALSGARTLKFQYYRVGSAGVIYLQSPASACIKYYSPLLITVDSFARTTSEAL